MLLKRTQKCYKRGFLFILVSLLIFSPGVNFFENVRAFAEGSPESVETNGIYEAEDATLENAIVDNKHHGYNGSGFVDFKPATDGSTVTWQVNMKKEGEYRLDFRYANGTNNARSLEIIVNGETVKEKLTFDPTSEWSNWKVNGVNAPLNSGDNVIIVKTIGANEGPNLDNLRIYQQFDSTYEAEDANITDAIVDNKHLGFTGTGFVDYVPNAPGGIVKWIVPNVPAAGEYNLEFRYGNGSAENRPAEISLNGKVIESELAFNSTGQWANWTTVSTKATLQEGENIIVAKGVGQSGGANIDHLRIHNKSDSDSDGRKPVEVEEVAMEALVKGVTLKKLNTAGILVKDDNDNAEVSRIEFFGSINRVLGLHNEEKFKNSDPEDSVWGVNKDRWWSYVLETAKQKGYVNPGEDGKIQPDETITRRETAHIIAKALDLKPNHGNGAIGAVISAGYMSGKNGNFGNDEPLTSKQAEMIMEKIAEDVDHDSKQVQIVSAEAISSKLVAVMLNGTFEDFDVEALTLKAAAGSFSGLNPLLEKMYPTRAAVGENKFGDTVVIYELQDTLKGGKLIKEQDVKFSGDLEEMKEQADNLVSWQMDHGGWTKSMEEEYSRPWDGEEQRSKQLGPQGEELGSIDNNATVKEIRFLSQVYRETGDETLKDSINKGIDFLLTMQYPTGGFPQVYPERGGSPESSVYYSNYVTFNDDAMIRVLELFDDMVNEAYPFDQNFLNQKDRTKIENAVDKGLDYILKSQIEVDGKLTAWCAQHDPVTYEAQHARSYEHPSISGKESVGIVKYLMSRPNQTPEIRQAISSALEWFDKVKLEGTRYIKGDPNGEYFVEDEDAVTWYRFYEIGTNLPIFSGRDGVIKRSILEIEKERRDGYSWAGNYAETLLEVAESTGYFENRIYAEVVNSEVEDIYGRNLIDGQLERVEDSTEELRAIPGKLTVAKDGSGDYEKVQQAIDAVPKNNTEPVEISIMNGKYKEVITVPPDKPFITLIGESAKDTVLTYDNYAKKERPEGGTYGTSGSASVFLYANDFTAKNLTIENSFDESLVEGGSQAVAAHTRGERMVFKNVRFIGNQDTLLANSGTQYYSQCYIEGEDRKSVV